MTPRCPPRSCIPPFCSISGMARCGQQRQPSIIPGLVTPPLQWPSSLPMSSAIVFECLPNDVVSLHTVNVPKLSEYSVSDDICDGFRGKRVLSDLDIV